MISLRQKRSQCYVRFYADRDFLILPKTWARSAKEEGYIMSNPNISLGAGFHFDEVDPQAAVAADVQRQRILSINPSLAGLLATRTTLNQQNNVVSEPLGDLVGFVNPADPTRGMNFAGRGFNMIFRPQSPKTPTNLPVKVPSSDNVLELNLTTETLSVSAPLGNVPNRGSGAQGEIFLNAVPYVQAGNDVTSLPATGSHFEPGMWLSVPPTTPPADPKTGSGVPKKFPIHFPPNGPNRDEQKVFAGERRLFQFDNGDLHTN